VAFLKDLQSGELQWTPVKKSENKWIGVGDRVLYKNNGDTKYGVVACVTNDIHETQSKIWALWNNKKNDFSTNSKRLSWISEDKVSILYKYNGWDE